MWRRSRSERLFRQNPGRPYLSQQEVPPVDVEQPVAAEYVEPARAITYAHAVPVVRGPSDHIASGADCFPNHSADRHGANRHWNSVVDVPVRVQRQVPLVQRVQKMVKVPQIQFIDKVVDAPLNMQPDPEMEHVASTLATEYIASATGVTHTVATDSSLRKRKSSGSLQSPRVRAGTRTQVQDDDIRHEVFHVNIASADKMEEAASVHALTSKRTPSELEHVKEDLKEARKMLEFLVRRERKVDTQTEVATRRLERLEREKDDEEDREHEANLEEALVDKTKVVKLVVDKWFVDRGFGFGKVLTGEIVFIHANAVVGAEVLTIGTDAWVQVVNDDARAKGKGIEPDGPGDKTCGKQRRTKRKRTRWPSRQGEQRH